MGRPLKTLRPVALNVSLDEDVAAKMEIELWSELEGKVPFGAKRDLINKLLRSHFRSIAGKRVAAKMAGDTELAAMSGLEIEQKAASEKALKKLQGMHDNEPT
jgi:hypothetical protein